MIGNEEMKKVAINHLISMKDIIDKIVECTKSNDIDEEIYDNIIALNRHAHDTYMNVTCKIMAKQKENGKEFISDKQIDDIISNVKKEFGI